MWHRVRTRAAAVLAVGAAVLAASAGVAVGTTLLTNEYTDVDGVFHACVQNENGNVRVVVPGTACREPETAIEWSQRGPQGPQGEQGPQGAQGPKGDAGEVLTSLDALDGITCKIRGLDGTIVTIGGGFLGPAADAFTLWCLRPDEFEPNNERAAAADVTSRVVPSPVGGFLSLSGLTLYPAGDEDWLIVHATAFQVIQAPFGARIDVYRDGELVAENLEVIPPDVAGGPVTGGVFANPVEGLHEWEFHVKPTSVKPSVYFFFAFGI